MSTSKFSEACAHYKFLRENGYPEKASLKLVGDRHRLSRMERNCMFRGIIVDSLAQSRKQKIIAPREVAGCGLGIDWYNVLITVESYLRGQPMFIADDGIARDASATHGSYRRSHLSDRAMEGIVDALKALNPSRVDAFLDSPIAFSAQMADELRERFARAGFPALVSLSHSADFPLKSYDGIVASSDSVILDSARRIFDLPRQVLWSAFEFTPPAVHDLFPPAARSAR